MKYMLSRGTNVPDRAGDLQVERMENVLLPILDLHRLISRAQTMEDQLEFSELDLMNFSVDKRDLQQAAADLGCQHLAAPTSIATPPPACGVILGPKKRVVVVRTVTIRDVVRNVAFVLDPGCRCTSVCHETINAFGLDPKNVRTNYARGSILAGSEQQVVLELQLFAPGGPHHDLNGLGMDYLLACVWVAVASNTPARAVLSSLLLFRALAADTGTVC